MKRIAVVEDNSDNRLLLQAILSDRFEVTEYEDGPSAFAAFGIQKPDLVLMDISLPGMDGAEVLALMRSDPGLRAIPVIAFTAHAMSGDREKYLSLGFEDHVTKPIVDEQVLLDAIGRLLGGG